MYKKSFCVGSSCRQL